MDQWLMIVGIVLGVFSVVLVGALIRRADWLTQEADQALIRLVVRVLVPALILDVVIGNPAVKQAANVALPPVVGFASIAVGLLVTFGLARAAGRWLGLTSPAQVRTFAACVAMYNYGYLPLPLSEQLFDRGTTGVLFVHNLGVEVAMWTIVLLTIEGRFDRQWWRRLVNGPLIAIVVATALNAAGVDKDHLPAFLVRGISMLGVCAIPMALLLIGATIADYLGEARLHNGVRVISAACLLRLGALPALFLLGAVMLPASPELRRVMVLQAAMPAATFPIILARHYGGDASTAVRVTLGTTLVSLLTMPLWLWYGLRVAG